MEQYDAIVVGAGPAGGQCARELSLRGKIVLLIDRAKDFLENNYSSGGGPLHMMEEFSLPASTVGTYWNKLAISSTNAQVNWQANAPFGPVLDFDKLRAFLAEETVKQGGEVRLGCSYQSHTLSNGSVQVKLKDLATQEIFALKTKVLVDATGSERKVLLKDSYDKNLAMAVTGIEYHLDVSPSTYAHFADSMHFFLGHQWMPQGYGWIFSMAPNRLKVGVIRYFQNKQYLPYDSSYRHYLDKLLALCGGSERGEIIDKHGKTIYYTQGQKERRHAGPVIAIGDAISSINPLGCEGIRHALASGRMGGEEITRFLNQEITDFTHYDKRMSHYFGKKWLYSKYVIENLITSKDAFVDRVVNSFGLLSNQDIMDIIFEYHFFPFFKAYLTYPFHCFNRYLTQFTQKKEQF